MDEDLKERQENEITVLKHIFLEELFDLTNEPITNKKAKQQSPGNDQPPPTVIRITLHPKNSESQCEIERECHVKIDLRVKLTPNYPNELPRIFLENEKGIPLDLVKTLHKRVMQKANSMIGSEMIFEICNEIQEFLYNNNRPPAKSFYDQRLENKINLEKEQLVYVFDEKKKCEEQLLAEIDFAVDLKRKMLLLERKKEKELEKRERLSSTNSPAYSRRDRERSRSNKSDSESREVITKKDSKSGSSNTSFEHPPTTEFSPFLIEFNEPSQHFKIKCIKLLKYDKENAFSSFVGIDLKTTEMYTIYQWQINLTRNNVFDEKKLETCVTEAHKLEEEFKRLVRLNNKLIFKYLAYKFFRDKNVYTAQLCLEYIEGNTLELLTSQQHLCSIHDNTLKTLAIQLLDALDYLHNNNLYHRDLKLSSVHLINDSLAIKLSDYGFVKRLNDLNNIVANNATTLIQGNLKSDIHQLGIILLSLHQGQAIKNYYPQIPTNLPPELKSFFSICINENNPRQLQKFDCKSLKSHPFILKNYDMAQPGAASEAEGRRRRRSSRYDSQGDEGDVEKAFDDYPAQSRLNTEFEVIGVVGHGAFGEVLKVKNKLDSRLYAIKRIRTNPNNKQYNRQIIREIKLLSRLNHENVVRYYSTWPEKYEQVYEGTGEKATRRRRSQSQGSNHSEQSKPPTNESLTKEDL